MAIMPLCPKSPPLCFPHAQVRTANFRVNAGGRHKKSINMQLLQHRHHRIVLKRVFIFVQNAARQDDGKSRTVRETVSIDPSVFRKTFLLSGAGALILPAMIHGMLKDGVTSWVPTYMTEMFAMPAQSAVAITILLPIINMCGAAGAYLPMRRVPNETSATGVLFLCAGLCLLFLQMLGPFSAMLSIILLAVVTAAMMGVNVIVCSEIPLRFSILGKSATVSGFFGACGYIGAAGSMYGIAVLSEHCGWTATQLTWIGSCVLAAVLSMIVARRWMEFRRKKWS